MQGGPSSLADEDVAQHLKPPTYRMIVKAPGIAGGVKTDGLAEFIDIYPSLCELVGLPSPDHLQGKSFVPLMKNPEQEWKKTAIGRYRNGDTIRTDKYRFTEYTGAGGDFLARMLYDHEYDPQEDANISELGESDGVVRKLAEALHKGKGKDSQDAGRPETTP